MKEVKTFSKEMTFSESRNSVEETSVSCVI